MIVNKNLALSKGVIEKDKWQTPIHIFKKLDIEFGFNLDPCAHDQCKLSERDNFINYTSKENGLIKNWAGKICFVNPPYSRKNIDLWVSKCFNESLKYHFHLPTIVVALLPVSTSSDWWHKYIIGKTELRFVNKRIRFVGAPYTAPFSSVIVIFGKQGIKSFNQ